MLLIGITIFCGIANAQSQLTYPSQSSDNYWTAGQIYYPEDRQTISKQFLNVVPLSTEKPVEIVRRKEESSTTYGEEQRGGPRVQQKRVPQKGGTLISNEDAPAISRYNKGLYTITNFGLKMFKAISKTQSGNVVMSPFSIASVLALLQQGAMGPTQEQISAALELTPTESVSAFASYTEVLKKRDSSNIFRTANNVFLAYGFTVNPRFKQSAQRNFNSELTPMTFEHAELAARQINSWVSSRTNNKIDQIVSPDSLGPNTQLVLVNALYFKGIWEVPFRPQATQDKDFFLSNGQKKTTQFMRTRRHLKAGIDTTTNARILYLPFELAEYSMMFILPSEVIGLADTLAQLTSDRLVSYDSFISIETAVEIPKFSIRADTELLPVLEKLGITEVFSQQADLNGIGSNRITSPHISSAVHSAVLSIDEQGGSAAASTAFAAVALSNDEPSLVFRANRPFIAVLWDNKSSLPLFMAKIEDPTLLN